MYFIGRAITLPSRWISSAAPSTEEITETFDTVVDDISESTQNSIIDLVYGKIPRSDFLEFVDALSKHNCKALDIIYGKISRVDFITISKKFNDIKR